MTAHTTTYQLSSTAFPMSSAESYILHLPRHDSKTQANAYTENRAACLLT